MQVESALGGNDTSMFSHDGPNNDASDANRALEVFERVMDKVMREMSTLMSAVRLVEEKTADVSAECSRNTSGVQALRAQVVDSVLAATGGGGTAMPPPAAAAGGAASEETLKLMYHDMKEDARHVSLLRTSVRTLEGTVKGLSADLRASQERVRALERQQAETSRLAQHTAQQLSLSQCLASLDGMRSGKQRPSSSAGSEDTATPKKGERRGDSASNAVVVPTSQELALTFRERDRAMQKLGRENDKLRRQLLRERQRNHNAQLLDTTRDESSVSGTGGAGGGPMLRVSKQLSGVSTGSQRWATPQQLELADKISASIAKGCAPTATPASASAAAPAGDGGHRGHGHSHSHLPLKKSGSIIVHAKDGVSAHAHLHAHFDAEQKHKKEGAAATSTSPPPPARDDAAHKSPQRHLSAAYITKKSRQGSSSALSRASSMSRSASRSRMTRVSSMASRATSRPTDSDYTSSDELSFVSKSTMSKKFKRVDDGGSTMDVELESDDETDGSSIQLCSE